MSRQNDYYGRFDSSLGQVLVTGDGQALTGFYFDGQKYHPQESSLGQAAPGLALFRQVADWFEAYLHGDSSVFDVALLLRGTEFQRRVWQGLLAVPAGQTITYGELARRVERPVAVRAVGAAVGRNPISVIVPCHRIIGSDGSLTGYAGGLDRKRRLLGIEGADAVKDPGGLAHGVATGRLARTSPESRVESPQLEMLCPVLS